MHTHDKFKVMNVILTDFYKRVYLFNNGAGLELWQEPVIFFVKLASIPGKQTRKIPSFNSSKIAFTNE